MKTLGRWLLVAVAAVVVSCKQCEPTPTCVPDTDAQLCAKAGAECGSLQTTDNCAKPRSIASCGACSAPQVCGGVTPNKCCAASCGNELCGASDHCGGTCKPGSGCCPQDDDGQVCSKASIACGPYQGNDNCGKSRTIASCGTCPPTSSCISGACKLPLACDGTRTNYNVQFAGRFTIHQSGSTSFGGGQHPVTSMTLCVEGNHHECWPLQNGASMSDVLHKSMDTGDHLTLWKREGSNAGGVTWPTINCPAPTNEAKWVSGGTSASFIVTPEQ